MKEGTELRLMFWFTLGYVILFTILAIIKKNYEFLYYTAVMSVLIFIIVLYYKKIHLTKTILLGLTILGVMHVCGGNIHISGIRLYDFWLIPNIFKYDNLVHAFGIFIATFVAYNFLQPHLDTKIKHNPLILGLILVLIAMGIGAIVELVELGAVLLFGVSKMVGDYMNNAFDLLFNLIGSIIACFFIMEHHRRKHNIK